MKSRIWTAFVALLAVTFGQAGQDTLLIATKGENTLKAAKQVAKSYGIIGTKHQGLYELKLKKGLKAKSAIAKLRKQPKVRFVFDQSAKFVESSSYPSVTRYVEYLEAVDELNKTEEESERAEYWRSLQFYLRDRVGPDGRIDMDAYNRAVDHRERMPAAWIDYHAPRETAAPASPWEYIGPNNLGIPNAYHTYDPEPRHMGPGPLAGRMNAVAVHPTNGNILYTGAASGGLFKSTDAGVTWVCLSNSWKYQHVSSIALVGAGTIYVGTGDHHGVSPYSMGIMKSVDAGATWTQLGFAEFGNCAVPRIIVDPELPNIVTAYTSLGSSPDGMGRIWRSTDSGLTWTAPPTAPAAVWSDASVGAYGAAGPRTYWAVGRTRIMKSTDRGATWVNARGNLNNNAIINVSSIAASKLYPQTAYYISSYYSKVYKTANGGGAWADITGNHPTNMDPGDGFNWNQAYYDYFVASFPVTNAQGNTVEMVLTGLKTVAADKDGNGSWQDAGKTYQAGALLHSDQHGWATSPSQTNLAYIANDGGLTRANYNPANDTWSFTSLSKSLPTTQHYQGAVSRFDSNSVMGGTQDNGVSSSNARTQSGNGDLQNWANIGGGDGGWVGYDEGDKEWQFRTSYTTRAFGGKYAINLAATYDNWVYDNEPYPWVVPNAPNLFPPAVYGTGDNNFRVYVGSDQIHVWSGSAYYDDLQTGPLGNKINEIENCPLNGNRLYTGAANGDIYRVDIKSQEGPVAVKIDDPGYPDVPDAPIGALKSRPSTYTDILVGLSTTSGPTLWRCQNTHASPLGWYDVSGSGDTGLPRVPINAIAWDDWNVWYVATDVGVFMSADVGKNWYNANTPLGLPNIQVNDLKIRHGYLYAWTWGRGIWRLRLADLKAKALNIVPTEIYGGDFAEAYIEMTAYAPNHIAVPMTSGNTAVLTVESLSAVRSGNTKGPVSMYTSPVSADTNVTVSAKYGGVTVSDTIKVKPAALGSITLNDNSIEAGNTVYATVSLLGAATYQGVTVNIRTDSGSIQVPPSVVVKAPDFRTATFAVTTTPVNDLYIRRIYAKVGTKEVSVVISLKPGGLMSFTVPGPVVGGNDATGTVRISLPLVDAVSQVLLNSDSPVATPPAWVNIPAGQSSMQFPIPTTQVSVSTTVTLTATRGNTTKTAQLIVNP